MIVHLKNIYNVNILLCREAILIILINHWQDIMQVTFENISIVKCFFQI